MNLEKGFEWSSMVQPIISNRRYKFGKLRLVLATWFIN